MRILIDYRAALRSRSGVGEYVHQLVTSLVDRAHASTSGAHSIEVVAFSSSWKDRLSRPLEWPPCDALEMVDRRIPVSVLNWSWHRLGWPPAETLSGGRLDVTHSMHPLILPSRRAASVVTVHDLNFLDHPEHTRAEIRRDYPPLARAHVRRAHQVIVPSAFTGHEVQTRFGVSTDRISVCSPGAPPWQPRTAARVGVPEGYILFLGTLEPRKNVGTLLDAYERLLVARDSSGRSTPELVLAGRSTPDAASWIDRARRAPLAGRVRFTGYIDPTGRQGLYDGARMLVQPSLHEGFGIPVLEAMTLGVPVVAADRGALPEVLGDAGLLVGATDPDALAHTIARLLDDPSLARSLAARGIERARRFSWNATASRTVDAYRAAIAHRAEAVGRS